MKYLLDTDHISVLQRLSGQECLALAARIGREDPQDLALSIVSFHEQVLGCHAYITRARKTADLLRGYAMLERLFSDYAMVALLPFDASSAALYDRLKSQHLRVGTMDLRIASIALARDLVLVTRNLQDFGQVPGLRIEDWTV